MGIRIGSGISKRDISGVSIADLKKVSGKDKPKAANEMRKREVVMNKKVTK